MRRRLWVFAVLIVAATPAAAEERSVELVPWLGVRGGADLEADNLTAPPEEASASGTLGFGVLVPVRPDAWFEGFVDHQSMSFPSFDLAIDYVQFGGIYQPGDGSARPFVAAAVGLARYGSNPGDVDNTIGLSGSIAGGVSVPVGSRVSFRFEVRGYAVINDAAVAVACGPGCFVNFSGSGWYQLAARAGLAIRL